MRNKCFALLVCCFAFPVHAAPVKEVVSASGVKAWLVEEHTLPIISLRVIFKDAGFAHDLEGKEGRANLVSDLLDQGADTYDALAFTKALEERAIALSFGVDEDLFIGSLKTTTEYKTDAFNLLRAALVSPRFAAEDVERVRAQTLSQLTGLEQNPDWRLNRAWAAAAYASHGYGNPSIGSKATVSALTREDLAEFTARYLTKENIIISVAGDISEQELAALLDSTFGALPAKYAPDTQVEEVTLPSGSKPIVVNQDIPQTIVSFGVQGLKRQDPRYFDAYVMNYLLGGSGSLTSRLGVDIREKRGLAYYTQTSLEPALHGALLSGIFATRNDQVEQAMTTLRDTLKQFAENGISDAELEDAKRYITGSFVLSLDTNEELTQFLTTMQLYNLGIDYLDKRNALVNAVTKENVNAIAKSLLNPDAFITVMIGNPNVSPDAPKTE